jgi:hypothetical protein
LFSNRRDDLKTSRPEAYFRAGKEAYFRAGKGEQ